MNIDMATLQDIADGKIKKHSDKDLTIYNNKWLAEHRQELSTLLPSIPIEYINKKLAKLNDDIKWAWYYGNVALDEMEYAKAWVEEVLLKDWEKDKNKYALPLAREGEAKKVTVAKEDLAPVDPIMQVTFEQVMQFCKERNLTVVDERLLNCLLGRL